MPEPEPPLETYGNLALVYKVLKYIGGVAVGLITIALALAQVDDSAKDWMLANQFSVVSLAAVSLIVITLASLVFVATSKSLESQLNSVVRREHEKRQVLSLELEKLRESAREAEEKADLYLAKADNLGRVVGGLEELAFYDAITGIPNSNYLRRVLSKHSEEQRSRCLILLDIRDFGKVNKRYGHWKGDQYLARFASMLLEKGRRNEHVFKKRPLIDEQGSLATPLKATAFRRSSGGDEFYILLNGPFFDGLGYLNRLQERTEEFNQMAKVVLEEEHPFAFQAGLATLRSNDEFGLATKRVEDALHLAMESASTAVRWFAHDLPWYEKGSQEEIVVKKASKYFGTPPSIYDPGTEEDGRTTETAG